MHTKDGFSNISINIKINLDLSVQLGGETESRMSYTRGIVVEYQYQGAGIGIVLLVVKIFYTQYQYSTCKAVIRNKEITENMYFEEHKTS